jgi:hypothetical protein
MRLKKNVSAFFDLLRVIRPEAGEDHQVFDLLRSSEFRSSAEISLLVAGVPINPANLEAGECFILNG